MSKSFMEASRNEAARGQDFHGHVNDRDLLMSPNEVVARVKSEIISAIVAEIMKELSPRLDNAIRSAWKEQSNEWEQEDKRDQDNEETSETPCFGRGFGMC